MALRGLGGRQSVPVFARDTDNIDTMLSETPGAGDVVRILGNKDSCGCNAIPDWLATCTSCEFYDLDTEERAMTERDTSLFGVFGVDFLYAGSGW